MILPENILTEIENISLNEKCNHRHFQNLNKQMVQELRYFLEDHPTSIVKYDPFIPIKKEYQVQNVIIDCEEKNMNHPLETIASELGLTFSEDKEDYLTYFKFTSLLRNNRIPIQLHIFNQDHLTKENTRKLNTLFLFNTNIMTIKSYFESDHYLDNFSTLIENKTLDDREDYWTIYVKNSVLTKKRDFFE